MSEGIQSLKITGNVHIHIFFFFYRISPLFIRPHKKTAQNIKYDQNCNFRVMLTSQTFINETDYQHLKV